MDRYEKGLNDGGIMCAKIMLAKVESTLTKTLAPIERIAIESIRDNCQFLINHFSKEKVS